MSVATPPADIAAPPQADPGIATAGGKKLTGSPIYSEGGEEGDLTMIGDPHRYQTPQLPGGGAINDWSPGSANEKLVASQATYRDQVADAVRQNAANGTAPTAEQRKTLGMSSGDVASLLAANNAGGRFTHNIATETTLQQNEGKAALNQSEINKNNALAGLSSSKSEMTKADTAFAQSHGFKMPKAAAGDDAAAALTPETIQMYAQQLLDEGKLPTGVGGYGKAGQAVRNTIGNAASALAKSQGLDNVNLAVTKLQNKSDQASITQAGKILNMTKGYEETVKSYIPLLKQQRADLHLSKFKKFADFEYAASKDWFGDPDAQRLYGTLYETLLDYSRVVGGNFSSVGLTDAARREGALLLSASNSPEAFNKVLDNFQNTMHLRAEGLATVPRSIVNRYGSGSQAAAGGNKTITRTGVHDGKKVIEYSDGTIEYAK